MKDTSNIDLNVYREERIKVECANKIHYVFKELTNRRDQIKDDIDYIKELAFLDKLINEIETHLL